jgi:CheY-like chemotaxis protein
MQDPARSPSRGIIASALAELQPSRKSILLVDDSPDLLGVLGTVLGSKGFNVVFATSGVEAIAKFMSNEVHAVVLDYNMPDIDGAMLAERIKTHRPLLPIVMFSGAEQLPKAALKNVDALVRKGETSGQLLRVLSELLPEQKR